MRAGVFTPMVIMSGRAKQTTRGMTMESDNTVTKRSFMPGTIRSTFHLLSHMSLKTTLCSRGYYTHHVIGEEAEA